jgi:2,4-dienoyl-CoA reductase (NADPH2)
VASPREIWLLQRKLQALGRGLGKTTGWIRRAVLARRGVRELSGVEYLRVDDEGLHILVGGELRCLPVDTVVLCVGQEPVRELASALEARGLPVRAVGGAREAQGLDAVRAMREGAQAALEIE